MDDHKLRLELAISMDNAGQEWLRKCWANGHLGMTGEQIPMAVYAEAALTFMRKHAEKTDAGKVYAPFIPKPMRYIRLQ